MVRKNHDIRVYFAFKESAVESSILCFLGDEARCEHNFGAGKVCSFSFRLLFIEKRSSNRKGNTARIVRDIQMPSDDVHKAMSFYQKIYSNISELPLDLFQPVNTTCT